MNVSFGFDVFQTNSYSIVWSPNIAHIMCIVYVCWSMLLVCIAQSPAIPHNSISIVYASAISMPLLSAFQAFVLQMHNLWNRVLYGSCSPLGFFIAQQPEHEQWFSAVDWRFIMNILFLSLFLNISAFLHFIPLETWQNKYFIQRFGAKYTNMAWLHREFFDLPI